MKTFKEYLTESKKVYPFKIKVAGELPEKFEENLKARLERCKVCTFEKTETTPVQKVPLDFPQLSNKEVHIFNVVLEYPITSPEVVKEVKDTGLSEECFRVRGAGEPSEQEQVELQAVMDDKPGEALLTDSQYKEGGKVAHKDYFGDDFNKGFLKDLAKAAKERNKETGKGEYKLPKAKQDKVGAKSAIGS
jgi:hypothetical protein